jgi:hypothetical protein
MPHFFEGCIWRIFQRFSDTSFGSESFLAFNFLRVFSILSWVLKLTFFKMTTTTAETMTETEDWREDRGESCKGERTRYF